MPSLGNLYVTIGAKADGLDITIRQAKKNLGSLSDVARATIKNISLLGAASVGAGAGIVAGLVNSGRIAIDTQAKLAQALDGTIGGLRAAEMAAGDAGVASGEFASAAARMNTALGNAASQAGPAYEALKNLGLSAEALIELDIDQRFAAISDAMAKHNMSGAQAQAVMRDLGVRSENLANLMRQGGDAFREQAAEVDRLGLRLSMVDAAKVEMANDALGIFGDVLQSVQDRMTVTAAPYITVLSEKFREAAIETQGFKDITESTINGMISGFGFAADAVHGFRAVIKGVEVVLAGFNAAVVSVFEAGLSAGTQMFDGLLHLGNKVIENINYNWGTNLQFADYVSDSEFMRGMHALGDESRNILSGTRSELEALAMQPMPSENIKKFMDEVKVAANQSAEAVVSARKSMLGGDSQSPEVDTGDKKSQEQFAKDMEAWNQKNAAELEALKERYITEEQLLAEHREVMNVIGSEYDAAKFESEAQWRSITEQAEAEHQSRLTELTKKEAMARKAALGNALTQMTALMNTNSRKAFEIGKASAIAQTIMSTYEAAQKSYSSLAGIPIVGPALGAAAAVAAIAGGMARVSAIRSQSFGSGGGGKGSVTDQINSNSGTVGGGGGGGSGGSSSAQTLTVAPIDPNAIFSGSAMIGFGQQIYNYTKDGGKVVFSS